MNTRFFIALWSLSSLAAFAQPAPQPPAFRSAFEGYQPDLDNQGDGARVDWKAANDTTARVGGWRVYAKEAAATAAPPTPAALPPSGPAQPTGPKP